MSEISSVSLNMGMSTGGGVETKKDSDAMSAIAIEMGAGSFADILGAADSLSAGSMEDKVDALEDAVSNVVNETGVSFNEAMNVIQNVGDPDIAIKEIEEQSGISQKNTFDEMVTLQELFKNYDDSKIPEVDTTVVQAINPTYQSTLVF